MAENHQLTLRLPRDLVEALRSEADETGRSINDLAGEVLARHAARREAVRAFREVARIRDRIEAERGLQPDSTPLLRSLRRGDERR